MEGRDSSERREEKASRALFIRRLKELFSSLDGKGVDPAEREGGIPSGFGWTESEEEYQRAQAAWLKGGERDAKGEKR